MFNHAYPYTNAHELNLDWLLDQYTNLVNEFSTVKIGFDEMKLRFEEIQTQFEGFDAAFEAFKQEVITQFGTLSADFEQRFNDLSQSIESQLSGIDAKIDQFEQTVNTEIADFKQEVEDDFTDFQTDVNAEITRFESEVDDKIDNLNVTDAVNTRIDALVQDGTLQGMAYEVVGNIWNDVTTYTEGQMVIHNNVLWKALQTSVNQEPESNEYWTATSVINEIENAAKNAFHVITEESEFEGLTVTATLVNSPEGITEEHTAIIVGGYAQIPFNNIGTWEVKVVESGLTYSETVTVDYYSTYIIRLQKLNAVINITTPDPELYGKTVKLDNGSSIITGVLSSTGTLTKRVRDLGTYIITCTDPSISSRVPAVTVEVSAYNTYNAILRYQYATIIVKTSETDLLGREVTATCEGQIYRGVFPTVLTEGYASVSLVVGKIGIYTIESTSVAGDEVTDSVEITEFYQTVETELSLKLWIYKDGIEYPNITGEWRTNNYASIRKETDHLLLKCTTIYNGEVYTENVIDFTKYSKVYFEIETNKPFVSDSRRVVITPSLTSGHLYRITFEPTTTASQVYTNELMGGNMGQLYIILGIVGYSASEVDFKIRKIWAE